MPAASLSPSFPIPQDVVRDAIRAQIARALGVAALPVTISVPDAGRVVGLSRRGAYRAAERDELPARAFGKKLVVPVELLVELLVTPTKRNGAIARDAAPEGRR